MTLPVEILTPKEAANYLRVSERQLRKLVAEGLPYLQYRQGGHKRFTVAALRAWRANQDCQSSSCPEVPSSTGIASPLPVIDTEHQQVSEILERLNRPPRKRTPRPRLVAVPLSLGAQSKK